MRPRSLFVSLFVSLSTVLWISASVQAQIRADASAPAEQRPTILQAGNGVPLVNIQTPSAAGVSRNSYSQFDVGSAGAILNNSRTNIQTQLGGWVQGNPWLATGSARIILNEVNSSNPSHLNGWIEVAGSRAQVITANPAGITCDGCGFINATQSTLATGTPVVSQGNLDGYRIQGGQVQIQGLGMDGRQADALTILSRSAEINAALWAKRLTIVTGTNDVAVDSDGQPTAVAPIIISPFPQNFISNTSGSPGKDNTAPVFALDVGYLGGMYAGHIFLVGSEQGLGVRQDGTLQAAEQLTLDSNGLLINRGKITAPELAISAQALTNTNTNTSSGLIDGQTVIIHSPSIENLGDARIYGDHLVLQAESLINAGQTLNNVTHAPVIAARNAMTLGVGTLDNRDGALIVSGGDLSLGRTVQSTVDPTTGQTRYTTTGLATRVHNDSATIDVLGDVFIQAITLANRNTHLQMDQVPEAPFSVQRIQPAGSNAIYLSSQCTNLGDSGSATCSAQGQQQSFEDYTQYNLTGTPSRSQVVSSQPAVLRVGGNFSLNGDGSVPSQLINQDSQVIVGGEIRLTDTALNNQDTKGNYTVQYRGTAQYTTIEWCGGWISYHCRKWHGQFAYNPAPEVTTIDLPTGQRYVGNTNQSSANSSSNNPNSSNTAGGTGSSNLVSLPALSGSASNALFTLTSTPQSPGGYLIETDPRFASYRQWMSSDYLLEQLAVDPAMTQKRVGDGYYEQSLIRDQVAQMTGRRFLLGYTDDEVQYLALMNNATTVAKELQLRPGIALSAEQLAQLTSDIVWLVTESVTLPDGSTTEVLVPKVYARIKEGDLQADGTLISGRSITAKLKGDFTNSGEITADQNLVVTAENIHNLTGSIDGRDVRLYADSDITNLGGRIAATDRLKLQAGRDLNVQSTTQSTQTTLSASEAARGNRFTRTQIDRVAGVYVRGSDTAAGTTADTATDTAADNTLNLNAGRNITLAGAQLKNSSIGTTTITAGEHLQSTTVTTGQDDKAVKDANNHSHIAHQEEVGTQISTTGALSLNAAQDLTLRAATVTSGGAITAQAGHDLRIEAGQADSLNDQARKTTSKGFLSSTTTTTRDRYESNTTLGTTISGNSVTAGAANDITIQGSGVVADNDVQLNAGRDLNIVASTHTHTEDHDEHKSKSGIFSAGGVGITIGNRTQSTNQQTTYTTSSASMVGSLDGNIDLQAARTYTQTGSDLLALNQSNNSNSNSNSTSNSTPAPTRGDITITAQQVTIAEARETSRTDTQTQVKQSGMTVALSAPIITAAQTVEQMGQAASNTNDPRMKALAAANAVMAVDQAAEAIKKNPDQLGGVNLSISLGSSKAQSQSTTTSDTSAPSHVKAANNLTVEAISDDITVQGSQLNAGNTITLQAEQEIKLQAAQDSAEQHSTNHNQSASIGVGLALGAKQTGVTLNLAASQGRGNADGSDRAWVNTDLTAGQQIRTESGTDTTIRGGVLTAPQVTVTTGSKGASGNGNLTIESLQDTSQYKSQQQQQGATLSIPVAGGKASGSVSTNNSQIDSDYASVHQQSGIRAGDGGFQVNVQGDTTLTGGAITSTQTAVDQQKNIFRTEGNITTTDINNKADYQAKGVGINLGAGFSPSGQLAPQGTGVGLGKDGDHQQSITQAAISDIAGNTQARTGDTETGLINQFDAERVQKEIDAQTQITQVFGTYTAKAIGDYAQSQLNQAQRLRAEADQLSTNPQDQPRAQQLLQQAKQIEDEWAEGGSYRIALHTATAGLSGGLSGALGSAATATAAPLLNDLQNNLSKALKQAGASDAVADGIATSISTVAAAGIGASTGIAGGNGVAGAAAGVNVDANNRQLHISTFIRLKEKCRGTNTTECKTINRMSGMSSSMPIDDSKIPASKVVENYDANGRVVSYTLIDRKTNQPTMIMEPLEFDAYRNATPGTQAMMQISPQYALDFASAGLYVVAGENSRAVEHMTAGVTSRDYVRDVALGVIGAAVSSSSGSTRSPSRQKTSNESGSPSRGTLDTLQPETDFTGHGTVRDDLMDHLLNPRISGKQISGGHNINEFNKALIEAGGTVVSKIETGPGIYEIQYQSPNVNKPAVKSVFDPVKYPDMENMVNIAASRALIEYQLTGNAAPVIQINGVNFDVRIAVRAGELPSVRTAFPIGGAK